MDPAFAHETNLPRILGVSTTFHFIALAFVALRLYARLFVVKAFGKDDACICVAAVRSLNSLTVTVTVPRLTANSYAPWEDGLPS